MTEKRFILKYLSYETCNGEIIEADPYYIDKGEEYVDEEDYYTVGGYPVMSDKQVVDLLNGLSEENKQLKKENKELNDIIDTIEKDYENRYGMSIRNADWFTAW